MYPLFQSHIDLAHHFWKQLINPEDIVIDATCGNGYDTLVLAQVANKVYALDLQEQAIEASKKHLKNSLSPEIYNKIIFFQGCHSKFPKELSEGSVKLIVYNLGYLPGGDKSKTTHAQTTLQSIEKAMTLISEGGVLSITCYPGHPEGKVEEEMILEKYSSLEPWRWSLSHHRWLNRKTAPSLLLMQKQLYIS